MTPAGFEPAVPLGERPKTHAVDHTATGIGEIIMIIGKYELSESKLRNFLQAPVTFSPLQPCSETPSVCSTFFSEYERLIFTPKQTNLSYFVFQSLRFYTYDGTAKV